MHPHIAGIVATQIHHDHRDPVVRQRPVRRRHGVLARRTRRPR